jgi:hypothetical protein
VSVEVKSVCDPVRPAYLRRKGAAAYCQVSVQTIDRWVEAGLIKGYRPSPGVVLYAVADLDRAVRAGQVA